MIVDVIVTLRDENGFQVAQGSGDDLTGAFSDLSIQSAINRLDINKTEIVITTEQRP